MNNQTCLNCEYRNILTNGKDIECHCKADGRWHNPYNPMIGRECDNYKVREGQELDAAMKAHKGVRVNGKTPNGGDYSEAFYLDDYRNVVEPDKATQIIINECFEDGTVISTTYAKDEPDGRKACRTDDGLHKNLW